MPRRIAPCLVALAVLAAPNAADADEGQWMPRQISELDPQQLAAAGLELNPKELYNPENGGLMDAVVNLSGCSAGFISAQGLIATNHHCAYAAIASQSSVEHDYLADGFFAVTQSDELPAKGRHVRLLQSITDVTTQVRKVVDEVEQPQARAKAVELVRKQLVDACEKEHQGQHCQVYSFYSGSEFQLHRTIQIDDIRLVYAPASGVGNYGGEVDNWMWPRHSGDFTLLRAYVGPDGQPATYSEENVPYQPKTWLKTSTRGVGPGDFVSVLGFPGHTDRYLPAAEARRRHDQSLPRRVDLYGRWIEILEEKGAADPAVRIKVASKLRSLANRHKNARGMIEGIDKIGLLARREAEEQRMQAWADQNPDSGGRGVLGKLHELAAARRSTFDRDFLVSNSSQSGNLIGLAIDIVRRAKEAQKDDIQRRSGYRDRDLKRLQTRAKRRLQNFDADVDTATMQELFSRVGKLPPGQRFTTIEASQIASALRRSRLADAKVAEALLDAADWAQIEASRDPIIVLAREIVIATEQLEDAQRARTGQMLTLGPLYFEMLRAVRSGPVYPDANGTLRFSYATVKGYAPADGLMAAPQTTVAGQLAKHTGVDPFDLPAAVRRAAQTSASTPWVDPALGDVPVCFLSTADTTGGNSGSPVIDGAGRWVGLNFDRVWENIAGDFGYHPARSRNITVDVRYLLWTLDKVVNAGRLLEELGVSEMRSSPATGKPTEPNPTAPAPSDIGIPTRPPAAKASAAPTTGAGCTCQSGASGPPTGLLLLAFGFRRRRRKGRLQS